MKAHRLLNRASDPQKYRPGRVDCPVGEITGYPSSLVRTVPPSIGIHAGRYPVAQRIQSNSLSSPPSPDPGPAARNADDGVRLPETDDPEPDALLEVAFRRPPDVLQISRLAEVAHRPAGAERDPGGSGQFDGDLRGGVAAADDEDPLSRVRHAMDVVAGVEDERVGCDPRYVGVRRFGRGTRREDQKPAGLVSGRCLDGESPRDDGGAGHGGVLEDPEMMLPGEGVHVAEEILPAGERLPDAGKRPEGVLERQRRPVGSRDGGGQKDHPLPHHAPRLGDLAPLQDLVVDPVLPEEMRKEESSRPAPNDDHVPHASPFPPTGLSYHRPPEMPRFPG